MSNNSVAKKFGYFWVTIVLFLLSLTGHWIAAWYSYIEEQQVHQQSINISSFIIETARDTFENWQSEFLQLVWQVAGLSFLWYVGSPQSKDGDDRKEEKIDALLRLQGKKGETILAALEKKYPKQ